jgi:hypothetical protein
MSKVCLICCSNLNTTIGRENVLEKSKVFASLSELLKVRRAEGALLEWWDFERDPLPFCPSCLLSTQVLSALKAQLDSLQFRIKEILEKIQQDILNSGKKAVVGKLEPRELLFRAQAIARKTNVAKINSN